MVEFKIELEDELVKTFGQSEIEKYLHEFVQKIILKISAQNVLHDVEEVYMKNDAQWKIAREQAWEQEKSKYLL